uniref:Uncharacterized protein n=1 Tax=Glossina austeni TaxID=7395 RepID=A0A1A9V4X4_GLOAU
MAEECKVNFNQDFTQWKGVKPRQEPETETTAVVPFVAGIVEEVAIVVGDVGENVLEVGWLLSGGLDNDEARNSTQQSRTPLKFS